MGGEERVRSTSRSEHGSPPRPIHVGRSSSPSGWEHVGVTAKGCVAVVGFEPTSSGSPVSFRTAPHRCEWCPYQRTDGAPYRSCSSGDRGRFIPGMRKVPHRHTPLTCDASTVSTSAYVSLTAVCSAGVSRARSRRQMSDSWNRSGFAAGLTGMSAPRRTSIRTAPVPTPSRRATCVVVSVTLPLCRSPGGYVIQTRLRRGARIRGRRLR